MIFTVGLDNDALICQSRGVGNGSRLHCGHGARRRSMNRDTHDSLGLSEKLTAHDCVTDRYDREGRYAQMLANGQDEDRRNRCSL